MKNLRPFILIRLALVACLAVALGVVGFGHRTTPVMDADLLAFLDAGGTFADICSDAPDNAHVAVVCEACQIAGSADVPSPSRMGCDPDLGRDFAQVQPAAFGIVVDPFDSAHMGRAPPAV